MKKNPSHRGGAREGAGRPALGKTRINLTLNTRLVEQAREQQGNISALLDTLLAKWLRSNKGGEA